MALVQKLRRWAPFAPHFFSTTRSHGTYLRSFLPRRGFCSMEQLTLANLGFQDDAQEALEAPEASIREGAKQPQRWILERSQLISVAPVAKPSREEMKQAALEASNILAGIAGMRLPRPKKLAGEQVALKQVALGEEEEVKLEVTTSVLENMEPAEEKMTLSHPWPEWIDFLEDIHAKGFFEGSEQGVEEGKHLFKSYAAVRHAVCAFGRSHSDIFRSLSRKDLRLMANYGCPDLERKASNASKRLRAHFRIPEGEVCQRCRLKMTCPRAFLAPPTKLPMNTLDVVRIITGFATNAWPNADCFTSYPKELETSVCNLLREILTFDGLPRYPDEGAPVERSLEPVQTKKKVKSSHLIDQKPGDWTCPNCEFLNFNRNRRCRECRVFRPPQDEQKMLPGDWECSKCRYLNFSKNMQCRECNADRLSKVKWTGGERLPDDYPSDRRQEKKYEASDDEGSWETALINSAEETIVESDANFTDEEETVLSRCSLNAASRRVSKATFRWNEDEEEEEGVSAKPREGSKIYDAPFMILKNSKGRFLKKW